MENMIFSSDIDFEYLSKNSGKNDDRKSKILSLHFPADFSEFVD